MVAREHHAPPPPVDPEPHAWYGVQRVGEVERGALEPKRLPYDGRLVPVAMPEQRGAERRQRRVLPYEALVYRRRGDDHDRAAREYLLEGPRVVVGVAVREYDPHDGPGPYPLPLQRGRGIGRRVDHDAPAVDPEHVAGRGARLVEAVRVSQDGDAEGRRAEGRGHEGHGAAEAAVLGGRRGVVVVVVEPDDADALADADVPREPRLADYAVVFVDVVQDVVRPARHLEYLHALCLVLRDLLLGRVRGVDLGHVA